MLLIDILTEVTFKDFSKAELIVTEKRNFYDLALILHTEVEALDTSEHASHQVRTLAILGARLPPLPAQRHRLLTHGRGSALSDGRVTPVRSEDLS